MGCLFCANKTFFSPTLSKLNCPACRSRVIHPTLVGLFSNSSRSKFEALINNVFLCSIYASLFLRFCSRIFFFLPRNFISFAKSIPAILRAAFRKEFWLIDITSVKTLKNFFFLRSYFIDVFCVQSSKLSQLLSGNLLEAMFKISFEQNRRQPEMQR